MLAFTKTIGVAFKTIYDRRTIFDLKAGGNIESILSPPPEVTSREG